jgi:integrase
MNGKTRTRGIFEKIPGSNIWWIRYVDADGRLRREKAGNKSWAKDLYIKRKGEALRGKKLPEKLRQRVVPFSELCADAVRYSKANHSDQSRTNEKCRIAVFNNEFGAKPAEAVSIDEIRTFFDAHGWAPGTFNRNRTTLMTIYRLGIENGKVQVNPAKLLKRKKVSDDRVRFLNQHEPLPTKIDYLRPHKTEESRLRAVIEHDWPEHMEEFDIAINTGMRRSEQYRRIDWSCVDLTRRDLLVPKSKNGESRHISLNSAACTAFEKLRQRAIGDGVIPIAPRGPIFVNAAGARLLGPRHWFDKAVSKAGLVGFTWHDLRHTFASRLVAADVNIRTVADLMGHKQIQMTMRYAHLASKDKHIAVERLARYNSSSLNEMAHGAADDASDTRTDTSPKAVPVSY